MATAKKTKKTATSKPVKPATSSSSTHQTALIVTAVVVAVFIAIPLLFLTVGGIYLGKKVADNGVQFDTNGKTSTIKDNKGNEVTAGNNQTMPKDFPADIKVYPGDISASGRTIIDGKTSWSVTVKTPDNANLVASTLSQQFSPANGWTVQVNNSKDDGGLFAATNGSYRATILYTSEDSKTGIVYVVTSSAD